jgi:SsrA-binding protein
MAKNDTGPKVLAQNRKARHDYFIEDTFEAGIELCGTEVKSVRLGNVNLKDSFCEIKGGEIFVRNMHISPYEQGNIFNRDPVRSRRLLMHKREINRLGAKVQQDGFTLVPLSVYLNGSLIKVEIALAKGKKLYDKRAAQAQKDAGREIARAIKERTE